MRHVIRTSCAAATALLFAALPCADAATFTVTTTADAGVGSLRQAILDANTNAGDDVIVFDLPGPGPHFIDLLSGLGITSNVDVLNDATTRVAREAVTVQRSFAPGTASFRLLSLGNGTRVTLAGLTLRNGSAPSGGVGTVASGGAIVVDNANLTLRDCVISGNTATSGGALTIDTEVGSSFGPTSITLQRCEFLNNSAQSGGAIYSRSQNAHLTVTAQQCVFRGNTATGEGGAIHVDGARTNSNYSLTDCSFSGNTAATGGALYLRTGSGIGQANLTMNRCTASGNSATGPSGGGGAIAFALSSSAMMADIENCTFSGNEAQFGGAIARDSGTTISLRSVTIAGNHARSSGGGGGGISCGQACQLWNSIVAANTSAGGSPDVLGFVFSRGHNLIGRADGSNGTLVHGQNGDQVGSVAAPLDPRLGPLRDNGGLTLTRALLAGSPAINAANDATAPPLDQRGMPRRGIADIGAFEFHLLARAELTRDRQSDIIWQNNATGQRVIWEMNGTERAGDRWLPVVGTEWQIATSGDFDGDGQTDLVWQNTSTGQRAIWLMNGAQWVGERFLPTIPLQWQIVGSGDFSGDGHTDLLWQNNETGDRAIWLMNGTQGVSERFLPRVPTDWVIAAVDEFTGDGHLDILWQNVTTGQVAVWRMNGTQWVGEHFLPTVPPQWRIAGSGDFNGDSHADIVWQNNATGQRAIWRMNGTQWIGESFLPTIPLEWQMRNH